MVDETERILVLEVVRTFRVLDTKEEERVFVKLWLIVTLESGSTLKITHCVMFW